MRLTHREWALIVETLTGQLYETTRELEVQRILVELAVNRGDITPDDVDTAQRLDKEK